MKYGHPNFLSFRFEITSKSYLKFCATFKELQT